MELDSVRELKTAVRKRVLARVSTPLVVTRRLDLAAQPVEAMSRKQPTIAIGIAPHTSKDYRLAVRIQARSMEDGPEVESIRSLAKGEVDIRYVGRVVKRAAPWHRRRNRPLRMGGSIGHHKVTAGTLGGFVRSRAGGQTLALSNNHVFANEDRGRRGDPILQPGVYDRGRNPADVIGRLVKAVRLKRRDRNFTDCAVASIRDGVGHDQGKLRGLGPLAGLGGPVSAKGLPLAKVGRTTGVTHGRVTAFELDNVLVEYDIGALQFDGQIEIEGTGDAPFSDGGDSGSLIVDADLLAVGLLFAGSEQGGANGRGVTYANPIRAVLDALRADLLY